MNTERYTESEHVIAGMSSYLSGNYIETVDHLLYLIELKLLHMGVTETNVKKGLVRDYYLGFLYRLLSINYHRLGQERRNEKALVKASLCGDTTAVEELSLKGINYINYFKKLNS